jgi:hypothetical protein
MRFRIRPRFKFKLRSKGVAEQDIITMVCILAAYLVLLIFVLPQVLSMILNNFSLFSAEVVSRDLSSLISASGIATDRIKITYQPSQSADYNLDIRERFVKVGLLKPAENSGASANQARQVSEESETKIAIDASGQFEAVKSFTIEKSRTNGKSIFDITAK